MEFHKQFKYKTYFYEDYSLAILKKTLLLAAIWHIISDSLQHANYQIKIKFHHALFFN